MIQLNEKIIAQISGEISLAGCDARELQMLERLEHRRITPDKEIPPMEFLFELFGKPCFPRGELVAVSGKAKSGKTFISSVLMSLCFKQEVLSVRRIDDKPLSVMWFDTEQSEESTQDILKNRIMPLAGLSEFPIGRFNIFNVRADFWQERLPLLETAIRKYTPDLVIVDGIRDLVNDINDGVMSQEVIERLMHLAGETRCCMVNILHQNKALEDKNLRGYIGTELKNKSFEVYECIKGSDRIFKWKQTDTRKYDIVDELQYTVREDGIPQLCTAEQIFDQQRQEGKFNPELSSRPAFTEKYVERRDGNRVYLNTQLLFSDAFEPGETLLAATLQDRVMRAANMTSMRFYNNQREIAIAKGWIVKGTDEANHVIYTCPGKCLT